MGVWKERLGATTNIPGPFGIDFSMKPKLSNVFRSPELSFSFKSPPMSSNNNHTTCLLFAEEMGGICKYLARMSGI